LTKLQVERIIRCIRIPGRLFWLKVAKMSNLYVCIISMQRVVKAEPLYITHHIKL